MTPSTSRAVLMHGPGLPLEVVERPVPPLGPGELLLSVEASEVCGTDVHLWHGRLTGIPWPIIPGHVSMGRILAMRGVDRDALGTPLKEGDRVTFLDVWGTCHRCPTCTVARQPNRCPSRRVYGITFSAADGLLGGWADILHLREGVQVVKLPETLPADRFIGGGCGLITGFAAVERGDVAMGDAVVVQGAGPVGLAAAAFAHLRGAGTVFLIGAPEARLTLAPALGVDHTLNLTRTTLEERSTLILEQTGGRGADVVIEASGNPAAVPEGLSLLRDGGTYSVAGHYTDGGEVAINPHTAINRRHAQIRGQWGTDFHHLVGALRMLHRHGDALPFERVIGGRYGLHEAEQALRDVEALHVTKALIVP